MSPSLPSSIHSRAWGDKKQKQIYCPFNTFHPYWEGSKIIAHQIFIGGAPFEVHPSNSSHGSRRSWEVTFGLRWGGQYGTEGTAAQRKKANRGTHRKGFWNKNPSLLKWRGTNSATQTASLDKAHASCMVMPPNGLDSQSVKLEFTADLTHLEWQLLSHQSGFRSDVHLLTKKSDCWSFLSNPRKSSMLNPRALSL